MSNHETPAIHPGYDQNAASYWAAEAGRLSAENAFLNQRIAELERRILNQEDVIVGKDKRIAELAGEVTSLRDALTAESADRDAWKARAEAAEAALERVRGLQRYDISPDGFGGITTTEHPTGDFVIALDLITALEGK